jgi:hypothetical protein
MIHYRLSQTLERDKNIEGPVHLQKAAVTTHAAVTTKWRRLDQEACKHICELKDTKLHVHGPNSVNVQLDY